MPTVIFANIAFSEKCKGTRETVTALTGLLDVFRESAVYRALLADLRAGSIPNDLGIIRAARPFLAAALAQDWGAPVLYLTGHIKRSYNVAEQLPVWLGADVPILRFTEPAPAFYERALWGEGAVRGRIETLAALLPPENGEGDPAPMLVVSSARALMQRTMPVHQFRRSTIVLRSGDRAKLDRLLERWLALGYDPVSIVTQPGQFSRRGGILDIFPMAADQPARIEFFDDEIESLRGFDPASQRSTGRIEQLVITPAREALPERAPQVGIGLRAWFSTLDAAEDDRTNPLSDADALSSGTAFPFLEHYLPYFYDSTVSLLEYAPLDALIIIDGVGELRDTINTIAEQAQKDRAEQLAGAQIAPDHPTPYLDWAFIQEALRERNVLYLGQGDDLFHRGQRPDEHDGRTRGLIPLSSEQINLVEVLDTAVETDKIVIDQPTTASFRQVFRPEQRFGGQVKPMLTHVRALSRRGERTVIVTQQAPRLTDVWGEQESYVPTVNAVSQPPAPGSVLFVNGTLSEGWQIALPDGNLHLFTESEIFGWNRPEPRRRKSAARRTRAPESNYADWREGDFVVHVDYGVGRFAGMRRRTIEGNEREYLMVEYAGTDVLYVPIHQADRLTRYIGADDKPPSLTKLGAADWARVKGKARRAILEEAQELFELYSKRAETPGYAYPPDDHWQHELEATFPFVETDDQLKATREVKADMESPHAMDRLICGDVGFGKTEVALRAAFKAVMSGKQVAVLVPTTVLAQQHYETFSARLAPFPLTVDSLSRFRTREEQNRTLARLAAGEIDIIIGTHRLLSDDVQLKELGLVIIDEEQRFGVKHKEHFKTLRTQVDVLTLTATPIPRTLYMTLTGIRDISMIQTPPEERLPVITHVGSFDEHLVRQAVLRELERGGQVFYVHNRVRSIEHVREKLEAIVPEARAIVAHGQMSARQLESMMSAFGRGEYDVLIATSIIENGIDIPNANTLIIDRADFFGMAQLYQLRGRVGRSAQQAYAYFFHPSTNRLTEEARLRLETLAENTDLGAGLQIAMRDLELRGAGDILSTRQTGQVAAVGLHLYTQMLTEAIQQMKGRAEGEALPPSAQEGVIIDLPLPAYLPTDWIPEISLRLQLYRRIAGLVTEGELDHMRDELRDRFGVLPNAVDGLLYQMRVKLLAQAANASAVVKPRDKILIKLPYLPSINRSSLEIWLNRSGEDDLQVTRTAVEISAEMHNGKPRDWQARLLHVLQQLGQNVDVGVSL